MVEDGLNPKNRRGVCLEALPCLSNLAIAASGPKLLKRFLPKSNPNATRDASISAKDLSEKTNKYDLIERMFATGLSKPLIQALEQIARCIPILLPLIQNRLLAEFSIILAHEEYCVPGSNGNDGMFSASGKIVSMKGNNKNNTNNSKNNTDKDKKKTKIKISTPREALKQGRKQLVNVVMGKKKSKRGYKNSTDLDNDPSPNLGPLAGPDEINKLGGIGMGVNINGSDGINDPNGIGGGGGRSMLGNGTNSINAVRKYSRPKNHPGHRLLSTQEGQLALLALKTLATFNMKGLVLLPFVRNVISEYLKNPNVRIRTQAVETCIALLLTHGGLAPIHSSEDHQQHSRGSPSRKNRGEERKMDNNRDLHNVLPHQGGSKKYKFSHGRTRTARFRCETLGHILTLAIADRDAIVRKTAIAALKPPFDRDLAQVDMLRPLFVALNDEDFEIREMGIVVVGRLTRRNPAYVMPLLRKTLVQLLTELEFSNDIQGREESSRLLALLIKASKVFVKPYLSRILNVLMPRLQDAHPGVVTSVLRTLGELSEVGGTELLPHCKTLFPLVINVIQDQGSVTKRTVAIKTLGQLVQSTGLVVRPFLDNFGLLDIIVAELEIGQDAASPPELRAEVMRTLGTIGAIDPYSYRGLLLTPRQLDKIADDGERSNIGVSGGAELSRRNSRRRKRRSSIKRGNNSRPSLSGPPRSPSKSLLPKYRQQQFSDLDGNPENILEDVTSPSQPLYYPKVAIAALIGILNDPSLHTHHRNVAQAIMHICRATGLKSVPFLPQIVPVFLHVMHNCEHGLRKSLCQQLGYLVSIVRQHIRVYLPGIFKLIHSFWNDNCEQILALVEQLSIALKDEIKPELPQLIPLLLSVFSNKNSDVTNALYGFDSSGNGFGGSFGNVKSPTISNGGDSRFMNLRIRIPESPRLDSSMSALNINSNLNSSGTLQSSATTIKALHTLEVLDSNLNAYLHLIVPALVSLVENIGIDITVRIEGLRTLARLNNSLSFVEYASRIIHSLLRVLDHRGGMGSPGGIHTPSSAKNSNNAGRNGKIKSDTSNSLELLGQAAMGTLCGIVREMGTRYNSFIPVVADVLNRHKIYSEEYDRLVTAAINGNSLPGRLRSILDSTYRNDKNSSNGQMQNDFPREYLAGVTNKLNVDQQNLRSVWAASQRSTRDDWYEWLRRFSVELLRESPQPALRSCSACAQLHEPLARELFNAAFISCWGELSVQYQDLLVRALETAFQSSAMPPEIVQVLLNLAEFMEHDDKALPIDIRTLAQHATRCHAFAKALHYKEIEFKHSPVDCTEALISIYNYLEQPEAAVGILLDVQKKAMKRQVKMDIKESWFEKLGRWEEALATYEKKERNTPGSIEAMVGQLRSLYNLWEWDKLSNLSSVVFKSLQNDSNYNAINNGSNNNINNNNSIHNIPGDNNTKSREVSASALNNISEGIQDTISTKPDEFVVARARNPNDNGLNRPRIETQGSDDSTQSTDLSGLNYGMNGLEEVGYLGAQAAWSLGQWEDMGTYVEVTNENTLNGAYLRAIINVHHDRFSAAQKMVDKARGLLDKAMTAMIRESYNRAYKHIVLAQELAEIEEVIVYRRMVKNYSIRKFDNYVVSTEGEAENIQSHLEHVKIMWSKRLRGCQRSVDVWQRLLAIRSLVLTPQEDLETWLEFCRICRKAGNIALSFKTLLTLGWKGNAPVQLTMPNNAGSIMAFRPDSKSDLQRNSMLAPRIIFAALEHLYKAGEKETSLEKLKWLMMQGNTVGDKGLLLLCHMRVGHWTINETDIEDPKNRSKIDTVLNAFEQATILDPQHFKAWDAWALMNYTVIKTHERLCGGAPAVCKRLTEIKRQTQEHLSNIDLIRKTSATSIISETSEDDGDEGNETVTLTSNSIGNQSNGTTNVRLNMPLNRSRRAFSTPSHRTHKERHSMALNAHAQRVEAHLVPAIRSFFRSVTVILTKTDRRRRLVSSVLQDMLRVLTLWFDYGDLPIVAEAMQEGLQQINIDIWLYVIPQLIARIHSPVARIRSLLHDLLCALGRCHPQALIYSLTVASNSSYVPRRDAAKAVLQNMRRHYPTLVDQAVLVSRELIRVAILWHEQWNEGLEEASKLFFGDKNVEGMYNVLLPLHEMMEQGPETLREVAFYNAFVKDLDEAKVQILLYKENGNMLHMDQAWELYYQVFRRINKQLQQLTTLELQYVSESLMRAKNLDLAVPGTSFNFDWTEEEEDEDGENANPFNDGNNISTGIDRHDDRSNNNNNDTWGSSFSAAQQSSNESALIREQLAGQYYRRNNRYSRRGIRIQYFARSVQVISSKQRPRKLSMRGSDGKDYVFLLKGHEDLRQDERVMQLFGLVNALLANDRDTRKRDLAIRRYSAIPLSHNVGIVGWVPHCDTLHQLVREYREKRKIFLNVEQRLMLQMAPDYDHLTVIQKVEAFRYGLDKTKGQDLFKVLWLKSLNSEVWLERRTNYTRSLAVMSMVGYILGLGDRHPSNLMLDRKSGKIIHIDFGDCFEVAMQRDRFPEKVPFRLTRMIVNAMEVSGIEGNFRSVCEAVMRVLRENKDSVMAMLEAFVHDPLINWRLLNTKAKTNDNDNETKSGKDKDTGDENKTTPIDNKEANILATSTDTNANNNDNDDDDDNNNVSNHIAPHRYSIGSNMSLNSEGRTGGSRRTSRRHSDISSLINKHGGLSGVSDTTSNDKDSESFIVSQSVRKDRSLAQRLGQDGEDLPSETINQRALAVINRVRGKLDGTDFGNETLAVPDQVDRLIVQATSHENLCQLYIGWCPFW